MSSVKRITFDLDDYGEHTFEIYFEWQQREPDVGIDFEGFIVVRMMCNSLQEDEFNDVYDQVVREAEDILNE